ncbi:MAG TPA: hypothetical protein VLA51_14360, partial [Paracoccaceae bacterium]|nr:hypothetical protein [Paracoccaceae bacterium]
REVGQQRFGIKHGEWRGRFLGRDGEAWNRRGQAAMPDIPVIRPEMAFQSVQKGIAKPAGAS